MEAIATASGVRAESRNFYVWMAAAFLAVAFGGFIPTYWAKMAAGTFPVSYTHLTLPTTPYV